MTTRNQKRLAVWLGLIAMWLLVVAPVVSQIRGAANANSATAVFCSANAGRDQIEHQHPQSAAHADACGYCHLFEHHAIVPGTPSVAIYLGAILGTLAAAVLVLGFIPIGAFPAARPRAPPLVF